jgi:hypothetical protein
MAMPTTIQIRLPLARPMKYEYIEPGIIPPQQKPIR